MQKQFQDTSPGGSESKFIKAWENEAKEWILETGSGGKTGRSCCCHGFPGFKCPLDFRIEEQKHTHEEREVFVYSETVSYTHLTLPTTLVKCRSRWSPYH